MLFTDMFAQTGKDIGEILHDLGEEEVEKRWNEENRIRQERTIDMGKLIEIADAAVEEKDAAMQRAEEYLDSITDQKSVKKCIMNMLEYTFMLGMKGKKSNYFDEDREANYREIEKMILSNPVQKNPKKPLGKWRERWRGSASILPIRENLKKQDMRPDTSWEWDRIFGLWYGLVYMHF